MLTIFTKKKKMFFPYLPNSATIDCYEYGEIHRLYFFIFLESLGFPLVG